ncbi:MAG: DUF4935 domain-containing protein, partial [Nitrospirae bacterium]|nr:DUF4935 domain-containing protein [Nitrospirota bacterium]
EFLPPVQKLEHLLGHNLNITEEIIHDRIRKTIDKHIEDNSITIIDLNLDSIDWNDIVKKSTYRIPPFDKGDNEKGFRDALISESFMQLIESSPKTPQLCRIVLVTNDNLLETDLINKTSSLNNVKVYKDIEDVKGLINTLASQVQEGLIDKIKDKANRYFFEKENNESLYYKENIFKQIETRYQDKLNELHPDGDSRINGARYISAPRFDSKKGQRITWKTRIDVVSKTYKKSVGISSSGLGFGLVQSYAARHPFGLGLAGIPQPSEASTAFQGLSSLLPDKDKLIAEGKTTFEITWSILVTTNYKFRNPKIESVDFVEINWEDKIE